LFESEQRIGGLGNPLCSRTAHAQKVLVRRAQLGTTQAALFITPAALKEREWPVAIRCRMATGSSNLVWTSAGYKKPADQTVSVPVLAYTVGEAIDSTPIATILGLCLPM
jgi:hypothetical protein